MLVKDQKNRADSERIKNLLPDLEHLNGKETVPFEVKSNLFKAIAYNTYRFFFISDRYFT